MRNKDVEGQMKDSIQQLTKQNLWPHLHGGGRLRAIQRRSWQIKIGGNKGVKLLHNGLETGHQ